MSQKSEPPEIYEPTTAHIRGTITNKREAEEVQKVIWEMILNAPDYSKHCLCHTPLNFGCLMSFDVKDGSAYKVPGYEFSQWFFVHCFECGYDCTIGKIIDIDILKHYWDDKPVCGECNLYKHSDLERLAYCRRTSENITQTTISCKHFTDVPD